MDEVSVELSRGSRRDDGITAATVLARALLAQGRLADAREVGDRAKQQARDSQNPAIRLAVSIVDARLLAAAGDYEQALRSLQTVLVEATDLGLLGLTFEARLASGEIEIVAGYADEAATGRSRLRALAREAGNAGFGLVAHAATAAAAR